MRGNPFANIVHLLPLGLWRDQSSTLSKKLLMPKSPGLSSSLLAVGLIVATSVASAASSTIPDFSGIWRLNDQQSDNPDAIAARLRAERKREETAAELPASASSSSIPATTAPNSHGGRGGGGHGMGGGEHGRGGKHDQSKASSDGTSPIVDTPHHFWQAIRC